MTGDGVDAAVAGAGGAGVSADGWLLRQPETNNTRSARW